MTRPLLGDVTPDTFTEFEAALRNLSADLDDPYRMDSAALQSLLFADRPAGYGILARNASGEVIGAALFSPLVSTAYGAAGAYVSDLWVAEPARGRAVGRALLDHVAARAGDMWNARFIRLMVYETNDKARRFYERLGFAGHEGEIVMTIAAGRLTAHEE